MAVSIRGSVAMVENWMGAMAEGCGDEGTGQGASGTATSPRGEEAVDWHGAPVLPVAVPGTVLATDQIAAMADLVTRGEAAEAPIWRVNGDGVGWFGRRRLGR